MSDWRELAKAIRAKEDERGGVEGVVPFEDNESELFLTQEAIFAKKVINEVLIPVLAEFAEIVTRTPAKPVFHEYDTQTFGVTCDLDSVRFSVNVYLLPNSIVRIAVFLTPSSAEPDHQDYRLSAQHEEIEEWFGDCLVKLYRHGAPVHGPRPRKGVPIPMMSGPDGSR